LIEYAPAHCDRCDKEMTDFCCDDVCVECEAEFLRNNPDEIPDTLDLLKKYPERFAPWKAAIDLLGDELELLTLIGQCQCGDRIVDKNTIESLLRLAYSMGNFQGTNDTIAAFVKQRQAA
jgi:hypothetical protein